VTARDTLDEVLRTLPDERIREVLNFARFMSMEEEAKDWEQFGLAQLARAYGPNEPEYTAADHKPELKPR
jgi:hypothetical protein